MGLIAAIREVRNTPDLDDLTKCRIVHTIRLLLKSSAQMTPAELLRARKNAGFTRFDVSERLNVPVASIVVIETQAGHLALCPTLARKLDDLYCLALDGGPIRRPRREEVRPLRHQVH